MVEQIVPFAEIFSTRLMVTREYTSETAGSWVSELHLTKVSTIRYMNLSKKWRKINRFSGRCLHLCFIT